MTTNVHVIYVNRVQHNVTPKVMKGSKKLRQFISSISSFFYFYFTFAHIHSNALKYIQIIDWHDVKKTKVFLKQSKNIIESHFQLQLIVFCLSLIIYFFTLHY